MRVLRESSIARTVSIKHNDFCTQYAAKTIAFYLIIGSLLRAKRTVPALLERHVQAFASTSPKMRTILSVTAPSILKAPLTCLVGLHS